MRPATITERGRRSESFMLVNLKFLLEVRNSANSLVCLKDFSGLGAYHEASPIPIVSEYAEPEEKCDYLFNGVSVQVELADYFIWRVPIAVSEKLNYIIEEQVPRPLRMTPFVWQYAFSTQSTNLQEEPQVQVENSHEPGGI